MSRLDPEVTFEIWQERAAILEFEAELPRAEAELAATREVFGRDTLPRPVAALRRAWDAAQAAAAARKGARGRKR